MHLRFVRPIAQLSRYVAKLWVFGSEGRLPAQDLRLFVPNGMVKLIVPFKNGLVGQLGDQSHLSQEHGMTLIGVCDRAATIDVERDAASGSIGIELYPHSAYRFFRIAQHHICNRIYRLSEVAGPAAHTVEDRIAATDDVDRKVALVQQFLVEQLDTRVTDDLFAYCVARIEASGGAITVRDLERSTGYSARWLRAVFHDRLGVGPKRLASIVRFDRCYRMLSRPDSGDALRRDLHALYYDESHFVRDFTRFTGRSPARLWQSGNAFGDLFYRS